MESNTVKIALLDLYDGHPNLGMDAIRNIVKNTGNFIESQTFDVRAKAEVPDLTHDIYIFSGGPGSPLDGDGVWDKKYYDLIQDIWQWNQKVKGHKKYALFICHSFQMACRHFGVAEIKKRRSYSFGIFPTHKTAAGQQEPVFKDLADPFYIADFRAWQVVQAKQKRLKELGAEILTLEKERRHVQLERAIMSIRFSPEMLGVQFHPEAEPAGMLTHFVNEERKEQVITKYGKEKYKQMIADIKNPNRIQRTHDAVIPGFLEHAIQAIRHSREWLVAK